MADLDLAIHALARIRSVFRARRIRDPREGGGAVSVRRAEILAHLDDEDPTMVGELADHLGVTPSTMSLTLKRMEAEGWVRRERDPADRRVTNVRLTESGARVRDARSELDPERIAHALAILSSAHRQEVLRGLGLLADAADALIRRGREEIEAQVGGGR
jgi:DNA-binding MarR family transcriptional regulator